VDRIRAASDASDRDSLRRNPVPYLLAVAMVSNIDSATTIVYRPVHRRSPE